MNPMNDDDDIDALLRQSFDGPKPDAGFCDRTMQKLPRRRSISWPLTAGLLVGAILYSLSLFASPLWRAAWQSWRAGAWSGSTFMMLSAMVGMSLLALGWALAEAEDH